MKETQKQLSLAADLLTNVFPILKGQDAPVADEFKDSHLQQTIFHPVEHGFTNNAWTLRRRITSKRSREI